MRRIIEMLAWLTVAVLAVMFCGCRAPLPDYRYHVERSFFVSVVRPDLIHEQTGGRYRAYNMAGCWITVPMSGRVDKHGKPLPDFYALGHELWHHPDLGGLDWHE